MKSRKKPIATLQEALQHSPYTGKPGSGPGPSTRTRNMFHVAPSTSDIFGDTIDSTLAKTRPKQQPSYRAPTFTSLSRKAEIYNALKSQTIPSQAFQPTSPTFPTKKPKSVTETSDAFSRESFNFAGLMEAGAPRSKASVRRRGEQRAASAKDSSVIKINEAPGSTPIHEEVRGKRQVLRKRKSMKTIQRATFPGEAAKEIEDFLGAPLPNRAGVKKGSKVNAMKNPPSNIEMPPMSEPLSFLALPEKDSDDFFSSDQPSPKHEYPILVEKALDSQSRDAMLYVQNQLSAWMNYRESITPVVSQTDPKHLSIENKRSDAANVATKRSATKTKVMKKKKSSEGKSISRDNSSKTENLLSKRKSKSATSQRSSKLDINGNNIEPSEFNLSVRTSNEETLPPSLNPCQVQYANREQEFDNNSICAETAELVQLDEPVIPLIDCISTVTQTDRVSSIPMSIQVGVSLAELIKNKTVSVEKDIQTEPEPEIEEEVDFYEFATVATQTNAIRPRKKLAVPCSLKIKSKPNWNVPFAIEVESLVSEALISAEAAVDNPVSSTMTVIANDIPPTAASDVNNNDVDDTESQTQQSEDSVDAEELAESCWESSDRSAGQNKSFSNVQYLNSEMSSVDCTATDSREDEDEVRITNCSSRDCPCTESNIGFVRCYERDVVPLIDSSANQGKLNSHTVGVSGIAKTWSLTAYNHPIQNHSLREQFGAISVSSIACDSPGFSASTQTLSDVHAGCQAGSSFKLYPLTDFEERLPDWAKPRLEPSDNFLNPESLLKMSDNVRQVITDLDLGTNLGTTLDSITTTFRALSDIVTDLVNPEDDISSEDENPEQKSIEIPNDSEHEVSRTPTEVIHIIESLGHCSLDPSLSETTY